MLSTEKELLRVNTPTKTNVTNCFNVQTFTTVWTKILYNKYIHHKTNFKIMLPQVQRISERILKVDNFENVAHVCCDWEEFVFEVAEWGVDHICGVDFDDLTDEAIKELDTFIASFGCSPTDPHPCSKYANPIFA